MALPVRQQLIYWGASRPWRFWSILWAMGDVILPFIVGGAVAYFLDPWPTGWSAWDWAARPRRS
jgi:predicted PurR-regulated permease PerM